MRHMGAGVAQQMAVEPHDGGTLKVVPVGNSLGIRLGPLVEKNSNSDLVARNWIALSCRSATGKPPLIFSTHEQPLPEHAPNSTTRLAPKSGRIHGRRIVPPRRAAYAAEGGCRKRVVTGQPTWADVG